MLRPNLDGTHVKIQTDHLLKWISFFADASGSLARLILHLSKFDLHVVHQAGIEVPAVEAHSCLQKTVADTDYIKNNLPVPVIDTLTIYSTKVRLENHQKGQRQDSQCQRLFIAGGSTYHRRFSTT